jgi:hypothetical protein
MVGEWGIVNFILKGAIEIAGFRQPLSKLVAQAGKVWHNQASSLQELNHGNQ